MNSNSPHIWAKSASTLFDLVNPPTHVLPKIPKQFDAQIVPQNFWIASEPPAPLMEETQIIAAFFWGGEAP